MYIFNQFCSFELSVQQRILREIYSGFHKTIKQDDRFQHE